VNENETTEEEYAEVMPLLGVVYPPYEYPPEEVLDAAVAQLKERWQGTLDLLAEHDRNYE
jgi:hypothetical protein